MARMIRKKEALLGLEKLALSPPPESTWFSHEELDLVQGSTETEAKVRGRCTRKEEESH